MVRPGGVAGHVAQNIACFLPTTDLRVENER